MATPQGTSTCLFINVFFAFLTASSSASAPPAIAVHPLSTTVVRGDPVTLDCRASSEGDDDDAVVEWYRDGRPVDIDPSARMLLPDGSLFLLRAMVKDSGVYWCVASNALGVARSANATLDVAYMKDEFRAVPSDTAAVVGSDVVMECSPPRGNPAPVVKWKKDGHNLDLTSSSRVRIDNGGNLVIYAADKSDAGRYQCAAENLASSRLSRPVRLRVNEEPAFVTAPPATKSALAGHDLVIECQVDGDPHPTVRWSKDGDVLESGKRIKVVAGKGLRLLNVHPTDAGVYVCTAENDAGSVEASTWVSVSEPPVISVRPEATVRVSKKSDVAILSCVATGNPSPILVWAKNGGEFFYPGAQEGDRIFIEGDGSLVIESPTKEDSGLYTCFVANGVGSAAARSNLVVRGNKIDLDDDARAAIKSQKVDSVRITSAKAAGPTSIKVTWNSAAEYVEGFRIWFRSQDEELKSIKVTHSQLSSFVINRLRPFTAYDVFVQPFYRQILGEPSQVATVETEMAEPDAAPKITQTSVLNATTLYMSWEALEAGNRNGPVIGYDITVRGNGSSLNNTLYDPDATDIALIVNGMDPHKVYSVSIAAINAVGRGPFSKPVEVELAREEDYDDEGFNALADPLARVTWMIVLTCSVTLFLVCLLVLILYKRRMAGSKVPGDGRGGYLEAADTPITTSTSSGGSSIRKSNGNLWIDNRMGWHNYDENEGEEEDEGEDCCYAMEKESNNGSEKKLLRRTCAGNASNSNSDSEYTYVDGRTARLIPVKQESSSPEPYASTDILKRPKQQHQQKRYQSQYQVTSAESRQSHYEAAFCHHSIDDLRGSNRRRMGQQTQQQRDTPNLLDILPPPPSHPPPPPAIYHASEESVISPRYLFQHPMYRVHPRQQHQQHYQEVRHVQGGSPLPHPLSFERNSGRGFRRESISAANSNSNSMAASSAKRSMENFEKDLKSELQNFNEAVTKLGRGGASDEDDEASENSSC